ncbi:MAG: hypothetical protein K0Q70_2567 [Rhodospirillales bacterium]|jgi:hypothetical protein|nr:hypothetical protein [Rhodospirillales bacterium]
MRGRSQRQYEYWPLDIAADRSQAVWSEGANFLIARCQPPDEPAIVYIGAAPDLFRFFDDSRCWETARWKFAADIVYAHPNASDDAREAERQDLIAAYAPPMNAENWQNIIAHALRP